jgi:hypothetical protein
MTQEFFEQQIDRLKVRFGEKAFDKEFVSLIAKECFSMQDADFLDLVNLMIATRKHNSSPILTDFREMRVQSDKNKFGRVVGHAVRAMSQHSKGTVHEALIRAGFHGCKTIEEALNVQLEKNRIAKALEEK